MRLSTIKLSGFKSFVDPTTLHLAGNMTGVVGPNGCGKSNIIDAVRWVMGESSASRLRGDSLTDVIFAGSSARKPVSQAVVELIFDNSDHTITGEFAAFNEISVKRLVSRDGNSQYYLNGTKCRRRDITDLFLGTGLGARSYSIIEQGMISQIIEARPEDLRMYLEEAAGISKYKERRKETETRIRHTRENLDRLNDLREEVGKQLEHLRRQARQAEQYQAIQADRRIRDAEWKALEYRSLDGKLQAQREKLSQVETRLQQLIAEQREAERQLEEGRVRRDDAAQVLSGAQAASYEAGGALARVEQQIQHQREMATRLQRARDEALSQLGEIAAHIGSDQARLDALRGALETDEPRLELLREEELSRQDALRDAEARLADWQQRWDAHARAQSDASRSADVERTRLEHLDRTMLDAERRRESLVAERAGLDLDALSEAAASIGERLETQKLALETLAEELDRRKQALGEMQEAQRLAQGELAETRKHAQAARGRLSSLETLQAAALGQEKGRALDWLRTQALDSAQRVGEVLSVDDGWDVAVESALGRFIEGVVVDDASAMAPAVATLGEGRLTLVSADASEGQFAATSLAAHVRGPSAVQRLLSRVHGAEDLAHALRLVATLPAGDMVITRSGERVGDGWLQVVRAATPGQGALARERDIQALRLEIETLVLREAELESRLSDLRDRALAAEQQREDAQRSLHMAHRSAAELGGQVQSQQGRLDAARGRIERIDAEVAQLDATLESAQEQARLARGNQEDAVVRMSELEDARIELEAQRRQLTERRDAARNAAREARDTAHALALTVESQRAQLGGLSQALERMTGQRAQLDSRLGELALQLTDGDAPVRELESQRQTALEQRVLAEQKLTAARTALDGIDHELRGFELVRQQRDEQALQQREAIGQRRLEMQALALKAEQLADAVTTAGFDLSEVTATLTDDMTAAAWERTVAELDGKLRRLEPVNLAAIQEHAEAAQRKEYLDAQHTDLTTALETLEDAIRRIDRETRGRFKDTFDRVNSGIQELYPRLFGGGHAYLELTGDDLLDTGVSIMARPPGKRVSNITLLSGGEKAMTAVALVFAIFRLNPAPFCLLDEVDAPLDEANVGRFTAMVNEMSEQVQFLFVTHNKVTMEAARQLMGVTMREPGVSRLVSVDLAEAARLAGAA